MSRRPQWRVLGQALAGWHASSVQDEHGSSESVSGYPPSPEPPDELVRRCMVGAWVYDLSGVAEDLVIAAVFKGPICSATHDPDDDSEGYRPLSQVGAAAYCRWLREHCPGVRLGRVMMHRGVRSVQWGAKP